MHSISSNIAAPPAQALSPAELTLEDLSRLPAEQQALFNDSRWLEPPQLPSAGTELPAPAAQQLTRETSAAMQRGDDMRLSPLFNRGNLLRRTSAPVVKGEYADVAPDAVPPFGCNNDSSNSSNGHALEDVIAGAADPFTPLEAFDYVTIMRPGEEYWPPSGGDPETNDALAAVRQMFTSDITADPGDPGSTAQFGEFSYRADLAPGIGPGGDCSAAHAYSLSGQYWKRFNATFNVLPSGAEAPLYSLLIAPSGALTEPANSSAGTSGRYQPFYFGTVSAAYGGGWIFGLESSSSSCEYYNQALIDGGDQGFFVRPIYGVLLKHWQQSKLQSMTGPWEGRLGWPVFGPVSYNNGTPVLTARGVYYAWGMWFERGFIWWVDYQQDLYPTTPDEAQLYIYTGDNVYCNGGSDRYRKAGPAVYYSDAGPLGVNVVVEAVLDDDGLRYTVPLVDSGNGPEAVLDFHAHGYGGTPDAQLRYKYTLWNMGDGTIINDSDPFIDDTEYVRHTYKEPGIYTVRVMIVDAADASQFGYSMPISVE